jgi:anti-sigma factor RsiW
MNCEQYQTNLTDYYYDELPVEQREDLANHLTQCAPCALEYCRLLVCLTELKAPSHPALRPEVDRQIRERAKNEFCRPWWRMRRSAPPSSAKSFGQFDFSFSVYSILVGIVIIVIAWNALAKPLLNKNEPFAAPMAVRRLVNK